MCYKKRKTLEEILEELSESEFSDSEDDLEIASEHTISEASWFWGKICFW
jgi:hypothetical protein